MEELEHIIKTDLIKLHEAHKVKQICPFDLFQSWLLEAKDCAQIQDHTAMFLSTCDRSGNPGGRILLLKSSGTEGFTFYTNSLSTKGKHLQENPKAEMCFYWAPINKQVRIFGATQKVSDKDSDEYFKSRHIYSQISAASSKQSQEVGTIKDVESFASKILELRNSTNVERKRPDHWHGYLLVPAKIEFWQDGKYRLHQRLVFERSNIDSKTNSSWNTKILYP